MIGSPIASVRRLETFDVRALDQAACSSSYFKDSSLQVEAQRSAQDEASERRHPSALFPPLHDLLSKASLFPNRHSFPIEFLEGVGLE